MDEGHWSEPLTLRKLVEDRLFPCLIRLEEGTRGREERLSFSSGDIMALQGSVAVKDKPLILAHYMNDTSIKDWTPTKGNTEMYRALIILPIDNIDVANLSISIFIDPSGEVYEQYVTTRFSDCNWVGRESELLVALGEEEDLDDIHEYLNLEEALEDYRNLDEETKLKEESSRPAKPPKTLPKPKRNSQSRHEDDVGHEDQRARQESQQKRRPPPLKPRGSVDTDPPPRPPRSLKNTPPSPEGKGQGLNTRPDPNREMSPQPGPPPPLPPRCHKLSEHPPPPRVLTEERSLTSASCDQGGPPSASPGASGQSTVQDEGWWSQGFTFADIAVPGESTYAQNEGSGQTPGLLKKNFKKKVKKFMKFSKGQSQADDADNGKDGDKLKDGDKGKKKKTKKFERQKQQSSFYHNINCKTDSPDEQPKTGDEDQEAKDDQDESGNDEYEEIDETLLGDPRLGPEGGVDQESRTRDKKAGREASDDKPTMWVLPQQTVPESSRKSEERLLQSQLPDVKGHSSPNKPPEYGTTSGTKTAENISNMSVKELCACLKKCGMGRLAEVCEKNILDGSFLDSTPDKTLTNEPFCLSSFDLLKLKQIKEGWRPNVGR